ncbi:unnamed protein product [Amoebophrya sp. A25]|nr:unnamed protein product [Amoebophrya sp. A25]|eukprot:GSA25T00000470001.1
MPASSSSGSGSGAHGGEYPKKMAGGKRPTLDVRGIRMRQGDAPFPSDARDLQELFDAYDRDGSGALSLDEFQDLINQWRGGRQARSRPITRRQIAGFMDWVDSDESKEIDKKEFFQFFNEAAMVHQMTEEMAASQQKLSAQRSTMLCYFVGMFALWAFFLFSFMTSQESSSSGVGFASLGLILTSIFLSFGVIGLLVVPIISMKREQLEGLSRGGGSALRRLQGQKQMLSNARAGLAAHARGVTGESSMRKGPPGTRDRAGLDTSFASASGRGANLRPQSPSAQSAGDVQLMMLENGGSPSRPGSRPGTSGHQLARESEGFAEQMADALAAEYRVTPDFRGPELESAKSKLHFSYRLTKIQKQPKIDIRDAIDEYYVNHPEETAPTTVPIEHPEGSFPGNANSHYAIEYQERARPQTAPGGRPRSRPSTPGGSSRNGRPRPIDPSAVRGGLLSGRGTPGSGRNTPTPRSQSGIHSSPGGRPATAPHRPVFEGHSPLGDSHGGGSLYDLEGSRRFGSGTRIAPVPEEGLWNDIPGYDLAHEEYLRVTPAGRPISAQSNREIYTTDLYVDAKRSQVGTPNSDYFNPMVVGDRWKSEWNVAAKQKVGKI